MAKEKCICTVQLLLDTNYPNEACDMLTALFSERGHEVGVLDWTYLKVGGQFLSPQRTLISEDYEEGEAF